MSKKTLYLLGIVLAILLGSWMYPKECCAIEETQVTDSKISDPVVSTNAFQLQGVGFEYKTNQNLKFLKNEAILLNTESDSIKFGISKLKDFLGQQPNQKVQITGYATSDEKNTTNFENLGLARAESVKNYFVSMGIPKEKFSINGKIIDRWKMSADTVIGPAKYAFLTGNTAATKDRWSALRDSINADPLILYYNTNQRNIQLTEQEKSKISTIQRYLENVPEAKVSVEGHTDNVGMAGQNIILGQQRADFTKVYLIKNGIKENQINSNSKGQSEPIENNATAEGRAKNRRTVITIN